MHYDTHNFHMNWSNASGMDKDMRDEMLVHELADVIVSHKPVVIDALRESGIRVSDDISRKGLTKLIADNAPENPDLQEHLAMVIVAKNLGSQAVYSSYSGCAPGYIQNYFGHCIKAPRSTTQAGAFAGNVAAGEFDRNWNNAAGDEAAEQKQPTQQEIASKLGELFGGLFRRGRERRQQQQNAKRELDNQVDNKVTITDAPKEGLPTIAWVGIGVAGVAVVGLVGYMIYKASKKAA